jgi:hypothetical protein
MRQLPGSARTDGASEKMMNAVVEISLGEIAAVVVTVLGGFAAVGKLLLSSFLARQLERDQQQQTSVGKLDERVGKVETTLNKTLTMLPLQYQRREDAIRFETILNHKLDAISARIERLMEITR